MAIEVSSGGLRPTATRGPTSPSNCGVTAARAGVVSRV